MTTKGYLIPLVFVAPKLSRILGNFPSPRFILVITGVKKSRKGPKRPAGGGGGGGGRETFSRQTARASQTHQPKYSIL